jgi:hypothetical protein
MSVGEKVKKANVSDKDFIAACKEDAANGKTMRETATRLGMTYENFVGRRGRIRKVIDELNDGVKARNEERVKQGLEQLKLNPYLPPYQSGGKGRRKDKAALAALVAGNDE